MGVSERYIASPQLGVARVVDVVLGTQTSTMSQSIPHAILYVFQVKKGQEAAFEAAWADVTREIQDKCGSLGSRLHTWVGGTYWAYAQWPSREALENAAIEGHATLMEARKRMVEACESMEVFGEGNIVHDLFVKED
jgi:quinol monooxygenase YgiN